MEMRKGIAATCLVITAGLLLFPFLSPSAERRDEVVIAVEKAAPAVVNIATEQVVKGTNPFRQPFGDIVMDPLFDQLFGPPGFQYKRESLGSGCILDPKGIIVTNEHVIHGATKITVITNRGKEMAADVVGSDLATDMAVLQVHPSSPLPFLTLGTSSDLMIGEKVIAIGNPFGLSNTVTTGVISALHRSFKIDERRYDDFIQTDASINIGNSGGALLNIEGKLAGVNTAIHGGAQGIGFAIPVDRVKRIAAALVTQGEVTGGWIGVEVEDLEEGMKGVLVSRVRRGSPGDKAGIRVADVIQDVDGFELSGTEEFRTKMGEFGPGDFVQMSIRRGAERFSTTVKVSPFPPEEVEHILSSRWGIQVAVRGKTPVITKVFAGSYMARLGIRPGDLLLQVNSVPVKTMAELRQAIVRATRTGAAVILVKRGAYGYYLSVPL